MTFSIMKRGRLLAVSALAASAFWNGACKEKGGLARMADRADPADHCRQRSAGHLLHRKTLQRQQSRP